MSRGLFIDPNSVIGKPARFLEVKQHSNKGVPSSGYALKVNVAPVANPSVATKGMIEKIEDARAMAEKHVFEQVSMRAGYFLPVRIIVATGMRGDARIN